MKAALEVQATLGPDVDGSECEVVRSREAPETRTVHLAAGIRVKYFGDYELIEEIARGGMGIVWKARQNSLNRIVAIKMILSGKLAGPLEVQRFRREAEAAANLQHPNIVAIHEVGEHEGRHYFSMDYVAGRDLGALARRGPLPPSQAARYVKAIALAIHFAHQRGTLHRDLKPQNVLIDEFDEPRITDFGLAKFVEQDSELTHSGAIMGSPSYMSPEQAAGRHDQVGPVSDVYSLGAILYELITGRPPFREATAMATLQKVVETEPVPPRRVHADVPVDLETICLKCLEKSPWLRYPSARELADDLQRFLSHEPIQARPVHPVRKAIAWARHHPLGLAAAAALVIVGLAMFAFQLIEENSFLRAQQADASLRRGPGSLTDQLKNWNSISLMIFMVAIFSILVIRKQGQQKWEDLFDPIKALKPLPPMTVPYQVLATLLGLGSVAYGLVFLARMIQAHVWEGTLRSSYFLGVWVDIWFGLTLLWLVIRNYQRTWFGAPPRELSAEQVADIRLAILDFELARAVRIYRRAVPNAGLGEAHEYVTRFVYDLQSRQPGCVVIPPFSWKALNWRLMAICAAIIAVAYGAVSVVFPLLLTAHFACQFLGGLVLGASVLIGTRFKGWWIRCVIGIPGMILIAVGTRLPGEPDSNPYIWATTLGTLSGILLLMSGYTKDGPSRRPVPTV